MSRLPPRLPARRREPRGTLTARRRPGLAAERPEVHRWVPRGRSGSGPLGRRPPQGVLEVQPHPSPPPPWQRQPSHRPVEGHRRQQQPGAAARSVQPRPDQQRSGRLRRPARPWRRPPGRRKPPALRPPQPQAQRHPPQWAPPTRAVLVPGGWSSRPCRRTVRPLHHALPSLTCDPWRTLLGAGAFAGSSDPAAAGLSRRGQAEVIRVRSWVQPDRSGCSARPH